MKYSPPPAGIKIESMTTQDQINELQSKLKALQEKQRNCKHDWMIAEYDPETVKEGYGMHLVGHGSDPYPEFAGYRDVQKDRWSRQCSHCGYKQYTYTQEEIIVGKKPKF